MTQIEPSEEGPVDLTSLDGAFVVLGVTGGIAAYKAVDLCRRLVDAGAHVVPVLTQSALRFVGVATFNALGSEAAKTSLFDDVDPIPHTRLGRRADLVVVAPATARCIGEYASGISRDLLGATLLATQAPVVVCPAMHTEMWQHDAVQENIETLWRRGVRVVPPESGRLAGGDVGEGRLADVSTIVEACARAVARRRDLVGVSVLVTAGGTREPIDPVRFISNRSSGKQGYAIAEAAARRGATVTLVTTVDRPAPAGVAVVEVETAEQLANAVLPLAADFDVVVMAAAVADFRPKSTAPTKMKKADGVPDLVFEPTPDILAELGRRRGASQVLVGFAAETDDAVAEGARKLAAKGIDLVVVNDVTAAGVGFGHDTNAVTILDRDGGRSDVALAPKSTIAAAVLDAVIRRRSAGTGGATRRARPPRAGSAPTSGGVTPHPTSQGTRR